KTGKIICPICRGFSKHDWGIFGCPTFIPLNLIGLWSLTSRFMQSGELAHSLSWSRDLSSPCVVLLGRYWRSTLLFAAPSRWDFLLALRFGHPSWLPSARVLPGSPTSSIMSLVLISALVPILPTSI